MATVIDPDDLSISSSNALGTPTGNVFIDPANLTIELIATEDGFTGFSQKDGVSLQALYSFLKEQWKSNATFIKYEFPMEAITSEQFEFRKGWALDDTNTDSRTYVRSGGWAEKNASDVTVAEYMSVITLGTILAGQKAYYAWFDPDTSSFLTSATDFAYDEAVNQAVKIYEDTNGDGTPDFNYRQKQLNVYIRPETTGGTGSVVGYLYNSSSTDAIGATTVTYQAYRFPLSTAQDLNLTLTNAEITSLISSKGLQIRFDVNETSAQLPIQFAATYNFTHTINGTNDVSALTPSEVYNFVQYQLRQNSDIDDTVGTRTGKLTDALVQFVGSTLQTFAINGGTEGVMIDNFDTDQTANFKFTDNTNNLRTFPRIASGSIVFNTNLVNDPSSKYWMFFSSNYPGASATLVPNYLDQNLSSDIHFNVLTSGTGTGGSTTATEFTFSVSGVTWTENEYAGDVLVVDPTGSPEYYNIVSNTTGGVITVDAAFETTLGANSVDWAIRERNTNVNNVATIPWTFDYDAADRGDSNPGANAPVTVVAIGLNDAQYVTANFTISDGSGQTFSVVSPLERNYSDPV